MTFLALDLSLRRTGAAFLDGPLIQVTTLPSTLTGCPRLADVRNQVIQLVDTVEPSLVVIEGYAMGRYQAQTHAIGELGGVIRLALWEAAVPYVELAPAVVKKLATGNGGAKKDAVLLAAVRRLGYLGDSADEADARWLLEAALQYWRHPAATPLPATHTAALAKVTWPRLETAGAA